MPHISKEDYALFVYSSAAGFIAIQLITIVFGVTNLNFCIWGTILYLILLLNVPGSDLPQEGPKQ